MKEKMFTELTDALAEFLPRLISALLVLFAGYWAMRLVLAIVKRQLDRFVDVTMHRFIISASKILMWTLITVFVMGELGLDTTSLIAALGAAGVAVGLALQGSLSNLAGGIIILFGKSFKVGDYIEVGGVSGTVVSIDLMFTNLDSIDNKRIVIPNSTVSQNTLINYTHNDLRRVDLEYDVSYSDDIDKVRRVLSDVAAAQEKVLDSPVPVIEVLAHGSSSIRFAARVWCKSQDYWDVYFAMNEDVKRAFDENGVTIPFEQVDVHFFPPAR